MGLYMKMNKTIIFLGLMFLFGMGQVISMEQPTPEVEIDEDGIANGLALVQKVSALTMKMNSVLMMNLSKKMVLGSMVNIGYICLMAIKIN